MENTIDGDIPALYCSIVLFIQLCDILFQVSVYIVDFGEYNAMALEEIKPLPWKFWDLPFQAFKCKLHGKEYHACQV